MPEHDVGLEFYVHRLRAQVAAFTSWDSSSSRADGVGVDTFRMPRKGLAIILIETMSFLAPRMLMRVITTMNLFFYYYYFFMSRLLAPLMTTHQFVSPSSDVITGATMDQRQA